ncbi:MAG: mannitol dehydrogenase family protein [Halioglobus sp.]
MARLSTDNLPELKPDIEVPHYARASVTSSVVHFGVGNFHRAHQATYCDSLLNLGKTEWGIIGISLRSPTVRDKLAPQDFLYTQTTLCETASYRVIGAIQDLLVALEAPAAVINAVARNQTRLVTTTITEKGYCLRNGEIDLEHSDISQDRESLDEPKTTYGYLAAALIQRCSRQGDPLTVLCCDNIQAGGEHLQSGVQMLLQRHSPKTLTWVDKHVAFSSSMVDRVTPATDERLKEQVAKHLAVYDAAPVAAEPFSQWVIEDNFAGERPPFDLVGALFVNNIAPFERVKLRFLNAAHSMLAALGYLVGDRFIHEVLQRADIARFTEQALKLNVLPVTPAPDNINCEAYIDQVLQRFCNGNLPYAVLQVGTDSSQKIQQRWFPTIDEALRLGKDTRYMVFALAAWVSFIRKALQNDDLNDPLRDDFARFNPPGNPSDAQEFLALAGAHKFEFFADQPFMTAVFQAHRDIEENGVEQALEFFCMQLIRRNNRA